MNQLATVVVESNPYLCYNLESDRDEGTMGIICYPSLVTGRNKCQVCLHIYVTRSKQIVMQGQWGIVWNHSLVTVSKKCHVCLHCEPSTGNA